MIGFSALLALALNLQMQQLAPAPTAGGASTSYRVAAPTDTGATAVRAEVSPVIDGKDEDQIWRDTPPITAFREWRPTEDKAPRFKTEAKIAYDASNLYVFVRAFDPHPDSIIKLLERRDTFTSSDMIWLFVDSYHDRRTGYEFGVKAAGVKIDQAYGTIDFRSSPFMKNHYFPSENPVSPAPGRHSMNYATGLCLCPDPRQ